MKLILCPYCTDIIRLVKNKVKYCDCKKCYGKYESDKWKYTSDGILIDDAPHNVIAHTLNNKKPSILFNYRNRYGWANLDKNIPMIVKCLDYSECLKVLDYSKKYFPK